MNLVNKRDYIAKRQASQWLYSCKYMLGLLEIPGLIYAIIKFSLGILRRPLNIIGLNIVQYGYNLKFLMTRSY